MTLATGSNPNVAESPRAEIKKPKRRRRLLWILALLGLIGIALFFIKVLVGMVIFGLTGVIEDAYKGVAKADIKTIEINIVRYRSLTGKFPDRLQDLASRPEGSLTGKWSPMMQVTMLNDPWSEPYQYLNPGIKNPSGYDLFSKGPDKAEGTKDDIRNW